MQRRDLEPHLLYVRLTVFARIIFGPLIFLFPAVSAVATLVIDAFDGELYKRAGYSRGKYSAYDKLLDYYWYIWILLYVAIQEVPYGNLFFGLFLMRTIGQFAYLKTGRGIFLFLFPNVFEIFFLYYLAFRDSVYMSPPFLWYALFFILITVLIREFIIHIRRANFSFLFFGESTTWVIMSRNRYKIFIFVVFLLAFAFSFSYLLSNERFNYKSRAMNASNDAHVVLYAPEGTVMGWIKGTNQPDIRLSLFDTPAMSNPRCVLLSKTSTYNVELSASLFVLHSRCFANLQDGRYTVFIETLGEARKNFLLEMKIVNGSLE